METSTAVCFNCDEHCVPFAPCPFASCPCRRGWLHCACSTHTRRHASGTLCRSAPHVPPAHLMTRKHPNMAIMLLARRSRNKYLYIIPDAVLNACTAARSFCAHCAALRVELETPPRRWPPAFTLDDIVVRRVAVVLAGRVVVSEYARCCRSQAHPRSSRRRNTRSHHHVRQEYITHSKDGKCVKVNVANRGSRSGR